MEFNPEEYVPDATSRAALRFRHVPQPPNVAVRMLTAQSAGVEFVCAPEAREGQLFAAVCSVQEVEVLQEVTITRESSPHFWDFCPPDGGPEQDAWKLAVVEITSYNAHHGFYRPYLEVIAYPAGKPLQSSNLSCEADIVSIMLFEGFVFLNFPNHIGEIHLDYRKIIRKNTVIHRGCGFIDSTVHPQSLIIWEQNLGKIQRYINFQRKSISRSVPYAIQDEEMFTREFLFEYPIIYNLNIYNPRPREFLRIVDARGFVWLTWSYARRGVIDVIVLSPDFQKVCEFSSAEGVEFVDCCPEGAILRKGEQHVLVSLAADEAPPDAPAGWSAGGTA